MKYRILKIEYQDSSIMYFPQFKKKWYDSWDFFYDHSYKVASSNKSNMIKFIENKRKKEVKSRTYIYPKFWEDLLKK